MLLAAEAAQVIPREGVRGGLFYSAGLLAPVQFFLCALTALDSILNSATSSTIHSSLEAGLAVQHPSKLAVHQSGTT
jgi:hypothetical protein